MHYTEIDESQVGINTARRNINNFRYAHDTTLTAGGDQELKSLMRRVKESEKAGLKLSIQTLRSQHPAPSLRGKWMGGINWKQ